MRDGGRTHPRIHELGGFALKLSSIEAIATALQEAEVRYLVAGGLAVAAHGFGRVTFDIDLVVQLQTENIKRAMVALQLLGYRPSVPVAAADFADPVTRESWIRDKGMVVFQLISDSHRDTPIDLFVTEPFDFDKEYSLALQGEILPGVPVRFVSLDTLLIMKTVADREKDREDIRQLQLIREKS
jgi:hypothetical protein